ncbi:MAG TPA: signal peptidase I [Candidatus Elarobacter sp.]|nr:signal peptidase I [Candidatus Elarobacter sp.]
MVKVWQGALALVAVLSVTDCARLRDVYDAGRGIASAMKPGHSYRTFYSPSGAMEPTIQPNTDTLLVETSAYRTASPKRGDIIAFLPPLPRTTLFLKRVLAIPGDRLSMRKGRIEVNGRPLPSSYPALHPDYDLSVTSYKLNVGGTPLDSSNADLPPRAKWSAPDRLPSGCYFVVGDNINNSEDSHVFGCAELKGTFSSGLVRGKRAELVGKVVKIIHGRQP